MNMTAETLVSDATTTATAVSTKPGKPQRRMARPSPDSTGDAAHPAATAATAQSAAAPVRGGKTSAVIALLELDQGATLADLIAATDWLAHTTRAALTGLRKKGHVIERSKRGEETCYRIVKPA
jgi:Protein of unknown function (DUF3489)